MSNSKSLYLLLGRMLFRVTLFTGVAQSPEEVINMHVLL